MGLIAESAYVEATKQSLTRVLERALKYVTDKPAFLFPDEPYLRAILERSILDLYVAGQTDEDVLERYASYCALAYARTAVTTGRLSASQS